jgi:hypothetical protein
VALWVSRRYNHSCHGLAVFDSVQLNVSSHVAGGIDLLLHLLSNITSLPVTKSVVKESGMGKAIGSVEKLKMCAGTLNEEPIKERVAKIKDAWNKSVKSRREKSNENVSTDSNKGTQKRGLDTSSQISAPIGKKSKVEDSKKSSSFSSLVKKMAPTGNQLIRKAAESPKTKGSADTSILPAPKKQKKRVKWKDHFGGNLTASKILENGDSTVMDVPADANVSWSDRRKRDRLREKELLAKAK